MVDDRNTDTGPDLDDLLAALDAQETIESGSPLHAVMHAASQEALRITAELNSGYHAPERVRELLALLTGRPVDESVTLFPPLRADFGRNLRLGARVFLNSGCAFQDQGGVTIGDDCLVGHNVVFATLNHGLDPAHRGDLHPGRIVVGSNVWIGANATLLPGVTIGDDAVIAAAAVVTKDVPAGAVVVGAPARVVRNVRETGADATP
ncbi:DapH/DapD/GlmU-related protein [Rathayibacter festucae]|uniref:DapH/DapD/GlmU-related protein n=1 Tax=Rathayibacter festucae TaxID=110937 RepID=UPI002A6A7879|nr:DapH/DapD/GlmU-related protein [Rathayibacter festucae]MDY0912977.1 DapH/DapD/GlmU-related protein [Rathayibacter festucae]